MMNKRILTICAALATGMAASSLALAQSYPVPPGSIYSTAPQPYPPVGYPSDYRRGVPDFDSLEDDEAPSALSSTALPPPGPVLSPQDPRYGRPDSRPVYSERGVPTGPILSPEDPRYGRPDSRPVYSERGVPTGPILSPDDPRYGRPDGPPGVIYSDRGVSGLVPYTPNDDGALRPPGAIGPAGNATAPNGVTGSVQLPPGPDGKPMILSALPPDEQPEVGPAQLAPNLRRQEVTLATKEPAGTLIVDTSNTYLYYVLGNGRAIRYGVRVGRDGFTWTGVQKISRKAEWPDWHPPTEMIERQPYLPRFMAGGPGNPLGARAMYLGSTIYRIHGTNQPSTIGKFVSSGCIGMLNEDVSDLFDRVKLGTRVVVLPGGSPPPSTATASAVPQSTYGAAASAPAQVSGGAPGTQPTLVPPLPAPVTVR
jgi:lipoprotein-anchoring transpeptidase ErfK/SrfK